MEIEGGINNAVYRRPCKSYGKFTAVDHLNLEIEGRYLVIGPNGAGRLLQCGYSYSSPTCTGTVLVDGVDVIKSPVKVRGKSRLYARFFGVYDNLKVGEYLDFYGDSYEIQKTERRRCLKIY